MLVCSLYQTLALGCCRPPRCVLRNGCDSPCSVLQCVAVCCSVLQCAAVCRSVLQCVAVCCSVLQCVAVCCSVLQCVTVCCSVLQCVAVCCSVLQCVAVCCNVLQCVAVCWGVLQIVAVIVGDTFINHNRWWYIHQHLETCLFFLGSCFSRISLILPSNMWVMCCDFSEIVAPCCTVLHIPKELICILFAAVPRCIAYPLLTSLTQPLHTCIPLTQGLFVHIIYPLRHCFLCTNRPCQKTPIYLSKEPNKPFKRAW